MRLTKGLLFMSLTLATACSDAFSVEGLAGQYEAIEFTGVSVDGEIDFLGTGASFTITLTAAGTTTGRLLVPDAGEDGEDIDESMAGTWTLDGSNVTFEQDVDTFVRDLTFVVEDGRLVAEEDFGDIVIRVVLEQA